MCPDVSVCVISIVSEVANLSTIGKCPSSLSYDTFLPLSAPFSIVNPKSQMQAVSSKAMSYTFNCRHLQKSSLYSEFQSWEQFTSKTPAPSELGNHSKFRKTLKRVIFLKKGDRVNKV